MHDLEKHFKHYLVLVIGLAVLAGAFYFYRFDYTVKVVIIVLSSAFYAGWGIIHHAIEGRLTRDIALEYLTFGLFVLVLLLTALNI